VAVGDTMFQVFQAFSYMLQAYVASVSVVLDVCFKCFIWMLQWLHTYVTIVCSQCFICFFRHMLQVCYVSHICCKVFYLDVAYGCNGFQVFSGVFFKCFRSMFQLTSDVCCKFVYLGVAYVVSHIC